MTPNTPTPEQLVDWLRSMADSDDFIKQARDLFTAAADAIKQADALRTERDGLAMMVGQMREALEVMPHSSLACMQSECFRDPITSKADFNAGHHPRCHWYKRNTALALTLPAAVQQVQEMRKDAERLRAEQQGIAKVIEFAHELGWDGVSNSKILASFLRDAFADAKRIGAAEWHEAEARKYSSSMGMCERAYHLKIAAELRKGMV